MIGQATSPIVAAVNALQSDVNGIKCKLPETVTLPYSCATAVPTQAVFNGYALGTYAGWNGCGMAVDVITLFGVKKGGNYVITYLY